jgi:hypothetical protein
MTRVLTDEALLGGLFAAQVAQEIHAEESARQTKQAAEREANQDQLAERLVADGFFHNQYQLESDGAFNTGSMQVTYDFPWNLPSRLFQFPMQTLRGPDNVRRIALRHPLLAEHPLVREIVAKGYELSPADECVNDCGTPMNLIDNGEWWHAVDLISSHYNGLLKTRQFTTDLDIFAAVAFRCEYPAGKGSLTTLVKEMREVLDVLGSNEPGDCESPVRDLFASPKAAADTIQAHFTIKCERSESLAWAYIHSIENGWFTCKKRFLTWSRKGTEMFGDQPIAA